MVIIVEGPFPWQVVKENHSARKKSFCGPDKFARQASAGAIVAQRISSTSPVAGCALAVVRSQ